MIKFKKTLCLITAVIMLFALGGCGKNKQKTVSEYSKVVDLIIDNEISVAANGCIKLPEELKYLSDSGECFIVSYDKNTAIYFYDYRGILESSKGCLYVTDKISYLDYVNTNIYSATRDFVNVKEIENNLYSCSTD